MYSMKADSTIRDYQEFVRHVYGKPNDLHYDIGDMLSNVQRFAMRALKGIRKGDSNKTRKNLLISFSWFMSTLNRMHIDLEDVLWKRFPYRCSYCGNSPCSCKDIKGERIQNIKRDDSRRPHTLKGFQRMFEEVYPSASRTLEHAGVHLAEEIGEFSEAILAYRGEHDEDHYKNIAIEAADMISCFIGVFNSLGINMADEISKMFSENCHECRKAPCECGFSSVVRYNS